MASRTTSWNRAQSAVIQMRRAGERVVRDNKRRVSRRHIEPQRPYPEAQDQLFDILNSEDVKEAGYFAIFISKQMAKRLRKQGEDALNLHLSEMLAFYAQRLKPRWTVSISDDIDAQGSPGWLFVRNT